MIVHSLTSSPETGDMAQKVGVIEEGLRGIPMADSSASP
jgi:hypothetical protein